MEGSSVANRFAASSEAGSPADWLPPRVTAHGSSSGLDQPRVFPVHFSDCMPSTAVTSAALSQRTAHKAVVGGHALLKLDLLSKSGASVLSDIRKSGHVAYGLCPPRTTLQHELLGRLMGCQG